MGTMTTVAAVLVGLTLVTRYAALVMGEMVHQQRVADRS